MKSLPKPPVAENNEDFNSFLSASHIGKPGSEVTVMCLGARPEILHGQFGDQIAVEVKLGKKLYDFGVGLDRPNYRILFEKFGKNPAKWRGKITLRVNPPTRKGYRPYVAVVAEREK